MTTWTLASLLVLSLGCFAGCSSGGSGSPNTGGSFDCSSGCDKLAGANCPNPDPKQTCVDECNNALNEAGSCRSAYAGLLNCFIARPFVCDASGQPSIDQDAALNACLTESIAYVKCGTCQADSSDGACTTCSKTKCCAQRQAIYDDPSFPAYTQCVSACPDGDTQCPQACNSKYPSVIQAGAAMTTCRSNSCATECSSTTQ
ncbi:MAG: hypothetical protein R3B13_36040 [Polyangiaceae bacterium]